MILSMAASATNPPLDLLTMYNDREVKNISTFADVAARLDPSNLVAAYVRARDSAPRRHDRNKTYFVDHSKIGDQNRGQTTVSGELNPLQYLKLS